MTTGVTWFGDRAVQVRLGDVRDRAAILAALGAALPDLEVRAGLESMLVVAPRPDPGLLHRVRASVPDLAGVPDAVAASSLVEVPVAYTGPDLDLAATALDCTASEVAAAHQAQGWIVAMMGFAPGFGYLVPEGEPVLPWDRVGRLPQPRTRVPAGSVGVAAGMSAVYPAAMPGGWLLVGTTTVALFDAADEERPALLEPGARVRFRWAPS